MGAAVTADAVSKRSPIPLSAISRQPAAIVGILIAVTAGAVFLYGDDMLTAQVASGIEIRITSEGFVPNRITVAPGQSITWKNEDSIPHVIASTTLPTTDSSPLESPPIFPGQTFTTAVTAEAKNGPYPYISRTASIDGEITLGTPELSSSSSRSRASRASQSRAVSSTSKSSSKPAVPSVPTAQLPVNPHTVDQAGIIQSDVSSSTARGGPPPAITTVHSCSREITREERA